MRVIAVDDEDLALEQFRMEIENIQGVELVETFSWPEEALEYIEKNTVEAAFLDIEMPGMSGIELAEKMRKICPELVIIFITGYEQYALDAFRVKADYYMLKPYDRKDILEVLERARLLAQRQKKRVYFQTFGRFDMFVDGQVVHFSNMKAKELLALCVDRQGGSVTLAEAVDKLWEDRTYDDKVKNLYRKAVMYLRQLMKEYGVDEVFRSSRGACNIDPAKVDCDYYQLLDGKPAAMRLWKVADSYLEEYSWAEETYAGLLKLTGGGKNTSEE